MLRWLTYFVQKIQRKTTKKKNQDGGHMCASV